MGSTVYAIGHPSGEAWTFSSGMVTQIRPNYKWDYENSSHSANVIQHEVPTNPGNSGGPLLDEQGLMVGVNSFVRIDSQLINFSVAIEEVEEFLSLNECLERLKTRLNMILYDVYRLILNDIYIYNVCIKYEIL